MTLLKKRGEKKFGAILRHWILRISLSAFGLTLILVFGFVGWRKAAQARVTKETALPEGTGVSSLESVILGSVEQWILIRGHDREKEIVLFVHGGPGLPNMPLSHLQADLEKQFVVVQWDQRSAGKSYSQTLPDEPMTIDRFVEDAAELTDYLCEKFNRDRIYLLGHSWGSVVGLKAVSRYPEKFHGYIGVSQVTNVMAAQRLVYEQTLAKARERGITEAIAELESIGPPPFKKPDDHIKACRWLAKLEDRPSMLKARLVKEALSSPWYSSGDFYKLAKGASSTVNLLWDEIGEIDLASDVPSLPIPVAFIQGRNDSLIPGELIERYEKSLDAPEGKELIWLQDMGHLPHLEKPTAFVEKVVEIIGEMNKDRHQTESGL